MVRGLSQLAVLGLAGLPAALADVTCTDNASDQAIYTGASGATYQILCGVDYAGHDLPATTAATFADCIEACDATARCVDVSYSGQSCYLKSQATTAVSRDWVWTAKLITTNIQLDCENNASDNVEYTTSKNGVYQIMCGVDYGGGDLLGTTADSFEDCIAACDDNADCIDVSYVAPSCYLKKTIGDLSQVGYVWTAKQVTAPHTIPADDGILKCPEYDNKEYTDEQGNQWQIRCNLDYMYYDTGETHTDTMSDCISWCDGRSSGSCVSLTWLDDAPADQTNCWAHSQAGVPRNSQWHSMLRIAPAGKRAVRRRHL